MVNLLGPECEDLARTLVRLEDMSRHTGLFLHTGDAPAELRRLLEKFGGG
eukprot:gene18216-8229_t